MVEGRVLQIARHDSAEKTMSQADKSNDLRVLAVDDHPMMLDTLVDLDPPREVAVVTAATEAETFRYARDGRPLDLILLDLKLEGDLGPRDGIAKSLDRMSR
jgi:PleD family two-component response regulator